MSDLTCLFCNERKTVSHLFLDWCVSSYIQKEISEMMEMDSGQHFWICGTFMD